MTHVEFSWGPPNLKICLKTFFPFSKYAILNFQTFAINIKNGVIHGNELRKFIVACNSIFDANC